jgi:hypothetical protein
MHFDSKPEIDTAILRINLASLTRAGALQLE